MTAHRSTTLPIRHHQEESDVTTATSQESVQTRPSRCATHGLVEGTRTMPRLRFPFIVTGVMRLIAAARPFRCPRCGEKAAKP